tara:strand:+ start:2928 stop:3188 length:261 start_codon:yes stop_codon:yes gene_type:complete
MKEEIGINIQNPKFLGYGEDNQFHHRKNKKTSRLIMFFHVKINQEPTIDKDEADDFKWVTFDEIKNEQNKESALDDFFEKNPDIIL